MGGLFQEYRTPPTESKKRKNSKDTEIFRPRYYVDIEDTTH